MKNYEQLQERYLMARKGNEKETVSILSTLIGEIELEVKRNGKTYDEVLVATATKFKKNIQQTINLAGATPVSIIELVQVEYYLPKELSEDEIRNVVYGLIMKHGKDQRTVMSELKGIDGMNMKLASQIFRQAPQG